MCETNFFRNLARAVTLSILNAPEKSKAVAGIESVIMNYFDEVVTVYGMDEVLKMVYNELAKDCLDRLDKEEASDGKS